VKRDDGARNFIYADNVKSTVTQPEYIVRGGKRVSVILPIKEFQELVERAEDAADVQVSRARRSEARETHAAVLSRTLARLKANG
jgi:hypothetical protein